MLYKLSKISYNLEIRQRNKLNKYKIIKRRKIRYKKYWEKHTKDFKIYAYKFYAGKIKDGLNTGSIFNKESNY